MSGDKITFEDVREYESLFKLAPAFLLERFAKRNANIVRKFQSHIASHLSKLDDDQKNKLEIILNTQTHELQAIMAEAYRKTKVKQYNVLANPKYADFIEKNIDEIRKMV
jgi:hypothetical protein